MDKGNFDRSGGSILSALKRRLRARGEHDRRVDEELRHHLQERIDRLVEAGATPEDARREAERRLGSIERIRRDCRAARRRGEVEALWRRIPEQRVREIRLALRAARQAPGFATAVILTLALGVGASTAVYSVVDAVFLRPLPYRSPGELVKAHAFDPTTEESLPWLPAASVSEWMQQLHGEVLFHGRHRVTRTDGEQASSLSLEAVSTDWLDTLGVAPAIGRGFTRAESVQGAGDVMIVSHALWRNAFGEDPDIVGRRLRIDGRAVSIVGVMPRGFEFPALPSAQAWVPLGDDGSAVGRQVERLEMVARLPAGITPDTYADRLGSAIADLDPPADSESSLRVRVGPFDDFRANRDTTRGLWMVTAAVGVMLLIAVVHVVNLQLVRGWARRDELRVRAALGASRGRLLRQILLETLALAGVAAGIALLLAEGLIRALVDLLPGEIVFFLVGEIRLDLRVFAFACTVTVLGGIVAGLVPGLRLSRGAVDTRSRGTGRLGQSLVVVQVALAALLLIGAGMFARSFLQLMAVEPGFASERLLYVGVGAPEVDYPDSASRGVLMRSIRETVESLPGVESAVLAQGLPPDTGFMINPAVESEGGTRLAPMLMLPHARIGPGFFETVGVELLAGRSFALDELPEDRVAIVDVDLAGALWPNENPLGERFRTGDNGDWWTVVGVAQDVKMRGLDDREARYAMFTPLRTDEIAWTYTSVAIRTSGDPGALIRPVRGAIRRIDPALPLASVQTGDEAILETVEKPRFLLRLMTVFGTLALLLAGVGVYGVLAFAVRQRRRELGVRAALGATARDLRARVLREGLTMVAAGMAIGVGGWWLVGRFVQSLLYATDIGEPVTLAATILVVTLTATAACWIPASRATRVDPAAVLRTD